MDRDELLRLKQLSGLAALFADKSFSIPEHDLPNRPSQSKSVKVPHGE